MSAEWGAVKRNATWERGIFIATLKMTRRNLTRRLTWNLHHEILVTSPEVSTTSTEKPRLASSQIVSVASSLCPPITLVAEAPEPSGAMSRIFVISIPVDGEHRSVGRWPPLFRRSCGTCRTALNRREETDSPAQVHGGEDQREQDRGVRTAANADRQRAAPQGEDVSKRHRRGRPRSAGHGQHWRGGQSQHQQRAGEMPRPQRGRMSLRHYPFPSAVIEVLPG